jgi:hypothetical protein
MTKRIKPHVSFTVSRPDEVAECFEGVGPDLYTALWDLVGLYPDKRTPEEMEEPVYGGKNSLAKLWKHLAPEHQVKLNELAKARDAEWETNNAKWKV